MSSATHGHSSSPVSGDGWSHLVPQLRHWVLLVQWAAGSWPVSAWACSCFCLPTSWWSAGNPDGLTTPSSYVGRGSVLTQFFMLVINDTPPSPPPEPFSHPMSILSLIFGPLYLFFLFLLYFSFSSLCLGKYYASALPQARPLAAFSGPCWLPLWASGWPGLQDFMM